MDDVHQVGVGGMRMDDVDQVGVGGRQGELKKRRVDVAVRPLGTVPGRPQQDVSMRVAVCAADNLL
jgi:hypothetical protein